MSTKSGEVHLPIDLWRPPPGSTPASGDFVYLASDPGDYVGGGDTLLHTPATGSITVSRIGVATRVSVGPWDGYFAHMSVVDRLEPGYYPLLQGYPFQNPTRGGLSWFGNGNACNELTGWFVVDRVSYEGDQITSLELRFEQHCENFLPALRGAIRWN